MGVFGEHRTSRVACLFMLAIRGGNAANVKRILRTSRIIGCHLCTWRCIASTYMQQKHHQRRTQTPTGAQAVYTILLNICRDCVVIGILFELIVSTQAQKANGRRQSVYAFAQHTGETVRLKLNVFTTPFWGAKCCATLFSIRQHWQ